MRRHVKCELKFQQTLFLALVCEVYDILRRVEAASLGCLQSVYCFLMAPGVLMHPQVRGIVTTLDMEMQAEPRRRSMEEHETTRMSSPLAGGCEEVRAEWRDLPAAL